MKTVLKVLGFAFLAFIVLGVIGSMMGDKTPSANASADAVATANDATTVAEPASAPALEIIKQNETADEYARTVHVQVRNNSGELLTYAGLKSVYYDKGGNIVGTGMGNAVNIAAGATKTIDVMAMGIENAARYEVEVEQTM